MYKNKVKGALEDLDKNEIILQAVIIIDTFSQNLNPFCDHMPTCLLHLANRPLLDYTLECLFFAGVQEIILFCSSFHEQIRDFIRENKWRWAEVTINVVVSEGCRSFGDVMRDLDSKALIRSDFFLITGNLIGNFQLLPALEKHKRTQKLDKGAVMTLIFKECGKRVKAPEDEFTVALDSKTSRVLLYSKKSKNPRKIDIPMEVILETTQMDLRCDIQDTQISICSLAVPPLFSDNFDFQTREDFLRGILVQDDVITSTIYSHFLPYSQYAATVSTWAHYQDITHDVIHRWAYPLVPDMFSNDPYYFRRNNNYVQPNVSLSQDCKIVQDVMMGSGTSIGQNTTITRSVIGKNCQIGNHVTIEGAFIMDNVIVKDWCSIIYSVIGPNCTLSTRAKVTEGSILGADVVIDMDKEITGLTVQSQPPENSDHIEALSSKAYLFKSASEEDSDDECDIVETVTGLRITRVEDEEDWEESSESGVGDNDVDDVDRGFSPMPEDTNLFYNEVVDSLVRGYEDHLPCDNLMLEINSSRYAYNVTMSEVTVNVVRAVLTLPKPKGPTWQSLVPHLTYFTSVLSNYVRTESSQQDCLLGIEDIAATHPDILQVVVKIVHWFYEHDILSEDAILKWYQQPTSDVDKETSTKVRNQMVTFIKWLKEAEEQSDEEEDSDD